jgi:hypothetical protein
MAGDATQILHALSFQQFYLEIGRCIDIWKKNPAVPEDEMIAALGFTLRQMIAAAWRTLGACK